MGNVLSDERKQQVLALGRLRWPLRRIEEATGVRRETASGYLKAAGIAVAGRGRRGSKPAISQGASIDSRGSKPAILAEVSTDSGPSKPAILVEVSTDSEAPAVPGRAPSASACEAFREEIEHALTLRRNAMAIWQDLVDEHGFQVLPLAKKRGFLTGEGPEPDVEVLDVAGLGGLLQDFLDRGQEVVEGSDWRQWRP